MDLKRHTLDVLLEKAQEIIPDNSPDLWQKEIIATKKKTFKLLVSNRFNYFAYDLPVPIKNQLIVRNLDVIRAHPRGSQQAINDLFSGKIPGREAVYEFRNNCLCSEFAKQAAAAKNGVLCITGIYYASLFQTYMRNLFPGQDILSYFPYQGAPFEQFEEIARDSTRNSAVFPHGARLIDMDVDIELAKTAIVDDLAIYNNMVVQLESIESALKLKNTPKDQLKTIEVQLHALKTNCQQLKSLNNADVYLCRIEMYLLKCAIKQMDISYVKTNYASMAQKVGALPKSEMKAGLINLSKEIVAQYGAAKATLITSTESTNNQTFFSEAGRDQPENVQTACTPK